MPSLCLIIPAAGQSTRFGGSRNKLMADLLGRPVLQRSVEVFLSARIPLQRVILACSVPIEGWLRDDAHMHEWIASLGGMLRICPGGASRAETVRHALSSVPDEIEWVAIHDAARPIVSVELIEQTFDAARTHGAAVPAIPVPLTIKQAAGPLPAPVQHTVPRRQLWAMQTPQIMRRCDLVRAYEACPMPLEEVTDDAQLLELAGKPVWLISGEERNLKITSAMDLKLAELWLSHES